MLVGTGDRIRDCPETFATTIWNLWKWRNALAFRNDDFKGNKVAAILQQVKDYDKAWVSLGGKHSRQLVEVQVRWIAPRTLWVRLNTDGSVKEGRATTAGILKDCDGKWLKGYVRFIGVCSVPMAELWGIVSGLQIAWESGYKRVCLDTDLQLEVLLLCKPVDSCHPLASLLSLARSFLCRDCDVQFRHTFREANRVADALASIAFGFPLGLSILEEPLGPVLSLLSDDVRRVCFPRLISL